METDIARYEQKIHTAQVCGALCLSGIDPHKVLADSVSFSADGQTVFWKELVYNESGNRLRRAGSDDVLRNYRCRAVKDMWDGFEAVFDIGKD